MLVYLPILKVSLMVEYRPAVIGLHVGRNPVENLAADATRRLDQQGYARALRAI
jgi:hypothetical protein